MHPGNPGLPISSAGANIPRMTDLTDSEQRVRSIVESSGGVVRHRDGGLLCIELVEGSAWRLHPVRLFYVGRNGDRLVYEIDLREVPREFDGKRPELGRLSDGLAAQRLRSSG